MSTIIDEEHPNDFITYMFDSEPKDRDTIQLECPDLDEDKNTHLHIFEQLLMIFIDGLKYFYSNENNKVDISHLDVRNIEKINKYFISMNYFVNLDIYPTMYDYKFVFPDYFKNQKHIKSETKIEDFFYEIFGKNNCVYRISFQNY